MAESIMVAKTSFLFIDGGVERSIPKGATVRVGHPLLEGREEYFAPLEVDFDVEPPAPRVTRKGASR